MVVHNLSQITTKIASDPNLQHLVFPVHSLAFSLFCIGNNDYTGKLFGMSCDIAYRALQKMETDLAFNMEHCNPSSSHILDNHYQHLVNSGSRFSISRDAFKELIKLMYIEKI